MGAYSTWFIENRRTKSPIKYYIEWLSRWLEYKFRNQESWIAKFLPDRNKIWLKPIRFLDPFICQANQDCPAIKPLPKIVHLIGSLSPGGAERQLCNCAIGQKQLGYDVTVLVIYGETQEQNHYRMALDDAEISVIVAGQCFHPDFESVINKLPNMENILDDIPREFRRFVIDIMGELLIDKPDVLHCWLDHTNVWGGVAGVLTNVSRVVLSTRNVNPTHFSSVMEPYFHAIYVKLAQCLGVRFINNSEVGANDYAKWLDISMDRFLVVRNGVETHGLSRVSDQKLDDFREDLGVSIEKEIIAGVFRLSEEKQPLVFLEVIKRVVKCYPQVVAVMAGIGPLERDVVNFIVAQNLEDHVFMLGRWDDVATIYSSAKLTLLCSRQEGTPNVLLESQWLGCPVVSTKAGGAIEAIYDAQTGFLVDVGDVDGLELAVKELIENVSLRNRMAKVGPGFVCERFGMDRMVRETLTVYCSVGE